jgi:hypothetical protein
MANKDFMGPPTIRGGTTAELRRNAYVAGTTTPYTPFSGDGKDRPGNDRYDEPALPHNTNSAVNSEIDTYKLEFEPNVLDYFDTYTYHWKFFITPLQNAYDGTVLTAAAQTIIAESGVSDLTIDKVELHGIAVPSVEAGTGTQTLVKFEIVEPSSSSRYWQLVSNAMLLATRIQGKRPRNRGICRKWSARWPRWFKMGVACKSNKCKGKCYKCRHPI